MTMIEEVLPGRRVPPGVLVTARSHFVDRFTPDCEIIHLTEQIAEEGRLRFRSGDVRLDRRSERKWRPVRKTRRAAPKGRWLAEMRHHSPENWAHWLTYHLPLLAHLAQASDRDPGDALLLLPEGCPSYILALNDLLGLAQEVTNDGFTGDGIELVDGAPAEIRSVRADWVRETGLLSRVREAIAGDSTPLPDKVFLSRRDTRTLINEADIEARLAERGFVKLYPETLPVAAQIRLFREASEIVAIHGAALAPLLYCEPGQGPRHLLEIMPVGHMTNVFREMAGQVGTNWIGVRGRIRPEHVNPAYDFDQPFRKFSLDPFEADPVSIDRAFALLEAFE